MARVLVAGQVPLGQYPALQPAAHALEISWQAADATNFQYTVLANTKTLLLAMNPGGSAYTITVTSVVDGQNRSGDITAYSIPAVVSTTPTVVMVGPFLGAAPVGWTQAGGQLWFQASNAAVLFAVLTLP